MSTVSEIKKEIEKLENKQKYKQDLILLDQNKEFQSVIVQGLFIDKVGELVKELGMNTLTQSRRDHVINLLMGIGALQHHLNDIIMDTNIEQDIIDNRQFMTDNLN